MIKTRSIQLWNDVKRWYSLPFVQIKLTLPKAPNQESSLANWTLRFSKDHQYEGVWMGPLQKHWKTPKNWDHFGFQFFRLLRRKENIFCWFHSSLDLDTRVWFKQFVLVLKDWIKFKNGHHFLHVNPFCLCDGLHREDVHSGAMLTNIRWNYLWMLHMDAENTKFLEFIT